MSRNSAAEWYHDWQGIGFVPVAVLRVEPGRWAAAVRGGFVTEAEQHGAILAPTDVSWKRAQAGEYAPSTAPEIVHMLT